MRTGLFFLLVMFVAQAVRVKMTISSAAPPKPITNGKRVLVTRRPEGSWDAVEIPY